MCKDLETVELLKIDSLTRLYRELMLAKTYNAKLNDSNPAVDSDSSLQLQIEDKLKELIKLL